MVRRSTCLTWPSVPHCSATPTPGGEHDQARERSVANSHPSIFECAAIPGSEDGGPVMTTIANPTTQPVVIAMLARERGITGVHTHVKQLRAFLPSAELVTPHAWAGRSLLRRMILAALFGLRPVLERTIGPAHVWWYRTSHEWFLRRALKRRLQALGPCVVYAQCPPSARAALRSRTGCEQRVVLAIHMRISQADEWADKGHIKRGGRVFRSVREHERRTVPSVDALVFVSSWARSALEQWMPEVTRVPGQVIPNFVRAASETDTRVRGDLVSVGNLEAIKNHRYLLRVLAAAKRRGRSYTLDVFGEGVERRNLESLATELGIGDQVRLRGFQRDVQMHLPGYRAYVHASYSESSSLAIMEAMGAGLPVLSSDVGALSELFDDPEHGRFWPIDDPDRGSELLIGLLEDEGERLRAGAAARKKFQRDYDAEVVAPRLIMFLRSGAQSEENAPQSSGSGEVDFGTDAPGSTDGSVEGHGRGGVREKAIAEGERT